MDTLRPVTAQRAGAPSAHPTVLVAEDEESLRSLLRLVLSGEGYDAVVCPDGKAAAEELDRRSRVDLVLMDLRMPRMTGEGLLDYIRHHPLHGLTPVIAMSAYSDEYQAREVLARGANAFLPKPFTVAALRDALARMLSTS